MKPIITEEKLYKLMLCFVADFESKHHAQLDKLSDHPFHLTDRMGCAKDADLNYTYESTNKEKKLEQVLSSVYVDAVKTLESRGLVRFKKDSPLYFYLTDKGFSETKAKEAHKNRTWTDKLLEFCNKNPVVAKTIIGLIMAIFSAIFSFLLYPRK